jgi:predicted esterase
MRATGEIMPYRVYVPTTYKSGAPTPLVIALHGLGANEDSFFDSYQPHGQRLHRIGEHPLCTQHQRGPVLLLRCPDPPVEQRKPSGNQPTEVAGAPGA